MHRQMCGHEVHEPHAACAGRALLFALLGILCFPVIASALVALGVSLALTTGAHLVRSPIVGLGQARRSRRRAAPEAAPLVLVGEAEAEGGLG